MPKNKKLNIILASSSPRRQQMLKLIDVPFEIVVSHYEENNEMKSRPSKLVIAHAKGKEADVITRAKGGGRKSTDTLV